jgi:hypothetical protein
MFVYGGGAFLRRAGPHPPAPVRGASCRRQRGPPSSPRQHSAVAPVRANVLETRTQKAANDLPSPPSPLPEGEGREARANSVQHALRLRQHICVPKPKHGQPRPSEHGISHHISPRTWPMRRAVQLHHQTAFLAEKVHDVRSQGLLPPKLGPELSTAKPLPQHLFGLRRRPAKRAGAVTRSAKQPGHPIVIDVPRARGARGRLEIPSPLSLRERGRG